MLMSSSGLQFLKAPVVAFGSFVEGLDPSGKVAQLGVQESSG
jgi:hypothetical protein